jgi:hypothetical protein
LILLYTFGKLSYRLSLSRQIRKRRKAETVKTITTNKQNIKKKNEISTQKKRASKEKKK